MEDKELLPIGTTVLLKGANTELMIIGYASIAETKDGMKTADYMACRLEGGVINISSIRFFNVENIDKITELGYEDEEWEQYKEKLKENREKFKTIRENLEKKGK